MITVEWSKTETSTGWRYSAQGHRMIRVNRVSSTKVEVELSNRFDIELFTLPVSQLETCLEFLKDNFDNLLERGAF